MRKGMSGILAAVLVIIIFIAVTLLVLFLYGKINEKTFDIIGEMGKVFQGGG